MPAAGPFFEAPPTKQATLMRADSGCKTSSWLTTPVEPESNAPTSVTNMPSNLQSLDVKEEEEEMLLQRTLQEEMLRQRTLQKRLVGMHRRPQYCRHQHRL